MKALKFCLLSFCLNTLLTSSFAMDTNETLTFQSISDNALKKFYDDFTIQYARLMVENHIFDDYELALNKSKEAMDSFLLDENEAKRQYLFDVYDLDKKVGFVWFCDQFYLDPSTAWLCWITIDESCRNQNYATKTLLKVEEILKKSEVKKIGLNVYAKNVAAINLYKKLGYEIKITRKNDEGMILSYIMEKTIN